MPEVTPHHEPEEIDALLQAVTDSFVAARAALDEYLHQRLQWVSDNIPAYHDAAGAAYLDQRKVQDVLARVADLMILTFHPDRAKAASAYGPTLAASLAALQMSNAAMVAALKAHKDDPPPPEPEQQAAA